LRTPARSRQRGASLFFALIVLGLMTLLAVSAYNIGSVNLKVVANVQARQEGTGAADLAAQQVIGSTTFATAAQPYATSVDVDVNNDTTADYTASVAATCLTFRPYPAPGQILDAEDPCTGSRNDSTMSLFCAQTYWDVQSRATPASGGAYRGNAGADVTVHQGVSLPMKQEDAAKVCP
jgi:hypothetical protein